MGDSFFLLAIVHGDLEIVKYLDKTYNFNIKHVNYHGQDCFQLAKTYHYDDIIEYLNIKKLLNYFKPLKNIDKENKCHICHDEYQDGDEILKCYNGHSIHKECYFDYLNSTNSQEKNCILCKEKMIPVIIIYKKLHSVNTKSEDKINTKFKIN